MRLVELTVEEFTQFQENHPLSNYYQTINYALLMAENGFEYDLIGYKVENSNIDTFLSEIRLMTMNKKMLVCSNGKFI